MNVVFSHNSSIHFDFSHVDFCTHCGKKVFFFSPKTVSFKYNLNSQHAFLKASIYIHFTLVILDDFIYIRALHEDYVLSYTVATTQNLLNVKQT